jgi:hypothetical protein
MKDVIRLFLLVSVYVLSSVSVGDESCECPKLACDPCSFEKGMTFFTGKCGPNNSRVKSCSRPTCIPVSQPTAACPRPPSADSGPREPIVVTRPSVPKESAAEEAAVTAGHVKVLQGSVAIVRADGQKSVVTGEGEVREGDRLESGTGSLALVNFEGGNKLHLHPDTTVEVKEFKNPKVEESRRALLHLIKGKIRSQVEQKYNGKTSQYRITTRGAVAGVRGTDFVMEHHEGGRLETKVETFVGHVQLATLDEKQVVEILRGEGARFVAELPDPSFHDKDLANFIRQGTLSPVYKIPSDKLKELDVNSRVDLLAARSRKKAPPPEAAICQKPAGLFDQCLWRCTGNPKGESRCRTDQAGVACVRLRCNANGEWADETRLGAEGAFSCPARGEIVKDCDY